MAKEIMRQLPKEEIIYVGDSKRCPYGPRSQEEVRTFTWQMIQYLQSKNIKMLVIACNTAAAVVLEEVKRALDIPVVGVIYPGASSALKATKKEHIAVIGTSGTIASKAYTKALKNINSKVQVDSLACPPFVPLVEQGIFAGDEAKQIVHHTLQPLNAREFDTLILGCTHYPLLAPVIKEWAGTSITLISSGEETAREVSGLLYHGETAYTDERIPTHAFYTTGEEELFKRLADQWLEMDVGHVQTITIDKL
ncbi:glutamate racemase [Alkalicoccobacillus murimartini]|uniref:Glutamate racemase n=1 Tax=Alkalicoccobacillus murimartini TaxID=171685 RepID=A0ABT9YK63_9BACI|nr:glutamate racemase [Alkalicoccobacillus murimartini]